MKTTSPSSTNCGEIIRHYRTLLGMTQAELGALLGITRNSVVNWEQNKTAPDFYTVRQLHTLLNIPSDVLLEETLPGDPAAEMIHDYRKLNRKNRMIIRKMIALLLNEQNDHAEEDLREHYLVLSRETTPSAAGIGYPDLANPPEPCLIRKNPLSERADTLITVSGDSMEPKYFDGDLLYVQYTDHCENGEDAVCVYHEGFILKRYYEHRLYSLNVDRPFGDQHEYDTIRIMGKVIGVVDPQRDLPNKEDLPLLEKIFARELQPYDLS